MKENETSAYMIYSDMLKDGLTLLPAEYEKNHRFYRPPQKTNQYESFSRKKEYKASKDYKFLKYCEKGINKELIKFFLINYAVNVELAQEIASAKRNYDLLLYLQTKGGIRTEYRHFPDLLLYCVKKRKKLPFKYAKDLILELKSRFLQFLELYESKDDIIFFELNIL